MIIVFSGYFSLLDEEIGIGKWCFFKVLLGLLEVISEPQNLGKHSFKE
jgi:hypothetical protein